MKLMKIDKNKINDNFIWNSKRIGKIEKWCVAIRQLENKLILFKNMITYIRNETNEIRS